MGAGTLGRMRRWVLLLCVAVLVAACSGGGSDTLELIDAGDRDPAPQVTWETLEGDELSLDDLDGPVIINFWASWCPPCVEEAPELAQLHESYDGQAHLIGVNVRDSQANGLSFERANNIPFPSWYDPAGEIAADFGAIGPQGLPSTLLLDEDHNVALRLFGAVTFTQVANYMEPLLAEAEGEPGEGEPGDVGVAR